MSVGQPERVTQKRIVELFQDELKYTYLGNWKERPNNSNVEESLLRAYLKRCGYRNGLINKALHELRTKANDYQKTLYENNKEVYKLLRYGVQVKAKVGDNFETVQLINWQQPEKNDFAIAEEVTVFGDDDKRPDLVLYVNGIAIGVLELKRSTVSIGDGIRQSLVNQQKEFIGDFFSTVQFVFAGNDTEGLRYGAIGTPEKFFLQWKENIEDNSRLKLDKYLIKLCNKKRLLEIMYDFVLFDGGVKKLPRVHQYFGIKAAQEFVKRCEGGIIWHTQGSGKSIVMVLLAKWILENNANARVVVITDRDELDKQIERVFNDAGETVKRTRSGRELMLQLGQAKPRLLCSLVHKFGARGVKDFAKFIKELEAKPSSSVGELFIFVDECHRTQSGKLHKVMKALLPQAVFIGFTGTPLLKKDKETSLEVFGRYIHTYKFNEAVKDEVVLDLVYEARDIDQTIMAPERIDAWFDSKTSGLNDFQKAELRKKWGTMQTVLSSSARLDRVVSDIIFDFNVKPRLASKCGNAILVATRIFEACRYFEKFQKTELKGKCAIITSYNPQTKDITTEDTGANTETEKEFIYKTYTELLQGKSTEKYEEEAKKLFLNEPATMRLLIVVDKLLTGFDAPSCTYLYIDKSMRDHGLFQAICRVNRLDSEDKQFGYIIDYKDLFRKVESAVAVYTAELDYDSFAKEDCDVMLQSRIEKGRQRLDDALEALAILCEPVAQPQDGLQYIQYFCGNTEIPGELASRATRRMTLYKGIVALIRAYANLADGLESAGYSDTERDELKSNVNFYLRLREVVRRASGETLDLKAYESDMRHLIDTYIAATEPRSISPFSEISLIDLIVDTGIADAINSLPSSTKANKDAVAATIENNVRSKIMQDHLIDPAFFEEMSKLLNAIIKERKEHALDYEAYLRKIAELARKVKAGQPDDVPQSLDTPAKRALYNNLGQDEGKAQCVHETVMAYRPDSWRGNDAKEMVIKRKLYEVLDDEQEVERIFTVIKQQGEF